MSDTPETDKMRGYDPSWNGMLPYEFACRLERQRDEWMAVSSAKQKRLGDIREQRDAYAETLRQVLTMDPCADNSDTLSSIRERHPELAEAREP